MGLLSLLMFKYIDVQLEENNESEIVGIYEPLVVI